MHILKNKMRITLEIPEVKQPLESYGCVSLVLMILNQGQRAHITDNLVIRTSALKLLLLAFTQSTETWQCSLFKSFLDRWCEVNEFLPWTACCCPWPACCVIFCIHVALHVLWYRVVFCVYCTLKGVVVKSLFSVTGCVLNEGICRCSEIPQLSSHSAGRSQNLTSHSTINKRKCDSFIFDVCELNKKIDPVCFCGMWNILSNPSLFMFP